MNLQDGWTVVYQAGNGWSFRSKTYASEREAAEHARSQWERGAFKDATLLGPAGEMIELLQREVPGQAGVSNLSSSDARETSEIDSHGNQAQRRQNKPHLLAFPTSPGYRGQ